MTDREDPIRRRKRWEAFYREEGGLRDMIAMIKAAHVNGILEADPGHAAPIVNLKIGMKIADDLDRAVQAIMVEGGVAEHAKAHSDKIASIPDYKRRWAQGH